jgi:hypothetical protein
MLIDNGKKNKKEQRNEKDSKKSFSQQSEPNQPNAIQQGMTQENLHVQQEETPNTTRAVQQSGFPYYPPWPTSRPGPLVVTPGVGQRPINSLRPEQIVEVGYNQTRGTPTKRDSERY